MTKLKVGILGGTGMVGQKYITLLEGHPWFEVTYIAASPRSAGKPYEESVKDRWHMEQPIPEGVKGIRVEDASNIEAAQGVDFVFSALDSKPASELEEQYAAAGIPVVSNASSHRHTSDVPMLIPEANADHVDAIPTQKEQHGWAGFIAVKPNCSLQSYLTPLYALHQKYKIKSAIITTMQAISGTGKSKYEDCGVQDNIVPFIGGEEEKSEREPQKILGTFENGSFTYNEDFAISAHCNRVAVMDGHTACVSVSFEEEPTREEILELWNQFSGPPQELELPTAPKQAIIYTEQENRPQPILDRDAENGMAVTVGRLRHCNVLDWRFVGLSHNTVRGAAGGGILNAELLYKKGYLTSRNK